MKTLISDSHRQQGITLAVSLIFLLVLTIIGISAMSTSTLQEKMAGNMKDKALSFQSAESAIITAETWLKDQKKTVRAQTTLQILSHTADGTPNWRVAGIWDSANAIEHPGEPGAPAAGDVFDLKYLFDSPRYIIEDMGMLNSESKTSSSIGYGGTPTRFMYRITARGQGGTSQAVSLVQTTFAWY